MSVRERLRSMLGIPPAGATWPSRSVQIGVDFGTCWSKLVIRDYESADPFAFVVRPKGLDAGPNNEYRIPSAVTLHEGRLHFGWPGEKLGKAPGAITWTSVKMRAAFPDSEPYRSMPPLPDGLSAEDLAILVVTYLLQAAMEAAVAYTANLRPRCRPSPGVSMGVPMDFASREHLRDQFVDIVRAAFGLVGAGTQSLSGGISPCEAAGLLTGARARLEARGKTERPRDWVRSEAEAGLTWIVQSPRVPPGKYACVDVGAGTTDVSVFNIRETYVENNWVKSSLLFYSAKSSLPGVDAIDQVLCDATGASRGDVRGAEERLIPRLEPVRVAQVDKATTRIFEVYRTAWADAYGRLKQQSEWEKMDIFVLGGGGKISVVAKQLTKTPWSGVLQDRSIVANDFPSDLHEAPSGRSKARQFGDDANFLLVAYGLSFMGSDVPPIEAPDAEADFNPPTPKCRPLDQDEYYPK